MARQVQDPKRSKHFDGKAGLKTHHNPPKQLGWKKQSTTERWQSPCYAGYFDRSAFASSGKLEGWSSILHHTKCHCGIEESTAYSVKDPSSDSKGKTKAEADEKEFVDRGRAVVNCVWWNSRVSDVSPCVHHSLGLTRKGRRYGTRFLTYLQFELQRRQSRGT